MVPLSRIFAKPIDRPIAPVIKADDDAGLLQEVEEYVLTNEVALRLSEFLDAYVHFRGANGAWISGFFGSGKSHLLKMLALLLENRAVDGHSVLDAFLAKTDDEILRADLKKAVSIPSQSVLFNIDQKADVISKTQTDALLAVFVKVFDEMGGYYGKQGHIARFERDLDRRDLFGPFQDAYARIAHQPWTDGREMALLEGHNVAAAYAQVTGVPSSSAADILDKYRAEYKVSIEDFAEQVNDYVQSKGQDFRLNFFVDEVGQYVAENIRLMTNLQTLAESLATKCRGRAWLLVTAQEDMSDVIGEMQARQANDFSRIMARFEARMKLTSADVAEVIRRRLLLKNDLGIELLSGVYADRQNNFRTLFEFTDGTTTYRNYRDREEFVHSYPFVSYQFPLFQAVIRSLSQHSAFEGKQSSVGERSMLAVFQQVAKHLGDRPVGRLATFDLMFEGIRSALKTQTQSPILTAEKNLDDPLAVRLLKALFLVKYVREFRATVHNLRVLMLEGFDVDLPDLRHRIETALNLLEQQTYVQRTGDVYEYLTNEEKDVEEEIKNTDVDAVADELGKLVFDEVIKATKFRLESNGPDYAFARRLDDALISIPRELAIHVISPYHEHADNRPVLVSQAMGRDELLVILPPSDRLLRDLRLYKQTDKYIRQNITTTQRETVKRILADKQAQNRLRREELVKLVQDLVVKATLIVAGQEVDSGSGDAATRLQRGFHELVIRTYPNLRMMRGVGYTDADIPLHLRPASTLYADESAALSEAEQEILAFIRANQLSGLRTTLQSLDNKFEKKPYGWYLAAVQCVLAKLLAKGKVEARQDGTLLDGSELLHSLRNTRSFANVVLDPQIDFTASQIRTLKEFHANFFDTPADGTEAKALALSAAQAAADLLSTLDDLRGKAADYPFLAALDEPVARLQEIARKPYPFYLTDLRPLIDPLLDAKEQVIDPIRHFMAGPLLALYDDARRFLVREEANLADLPGETVTRLRQALADPACFRGNRMQEVKTWLDQLRQEVRERVALERQTARDRLQDLQRKLTQADAFAKLPAGRQLDVLETFTAVDRELEHHTLAAVIRDRIRRFEEVEYTHLLTQVEAWASPVQPSEATGDRSKKVVKPPVEYVTRAGLKVSFHKPALADEADVDAYLAALRQALLDAIHHGKRVQI